MTNFWILRFFISCPFITDSVNTVYEKYYPQFEPGKRAKKDPRDRIITKEEAMKIVEGNGMKVVYSGREGTIWRASQK